MWVSESAGASTRAGAGVRARGRGESVGAGVRAATLRGPLRRLLLPSALLLFSAACTDITRFSTGPGEAYCGSAIDGPFVRAGFGPGVRMRMHFDAHRLDSRPGTLSTSDDLLTDAPMRPIPQLFHDPLSTLRFGEQREKNLIYVVKPTGPEGGASLFAIVSLLHDGDAEVRLLRSAPPLPGTTAVSSEEDEAIFGVFPLHREHGNCGF